MMTTFSLTPSEGRALETFVTGIFRTFVILLCENIPFLLVWDSASFIFAIVAFGKTLMDSITMWISKKARDEIKKISSKK